MGIAEKIGGEGINNCAPTRAKLDPLPPSPLSVRLPAAPHLGHPPARIAAACSTCPLLQPHAHQQLGPTSPHNRYYVNLCRKSLVTMQLTPFRVVRAGFGPGSAVPVGLRGG